MAEKILDHTYTPQETGYFCGPGSTQIALTARGIEVSEWQLAEELGTDTDGTDWIGQITAVLARKTGQPYVTVEISDDPPTGAQVSRLWDDVVGSIDGGNAMVANIVAVPGNRPPGYPAQTIYHYVSIVGYDPETRSVYVADPARFGGIEHYWLTAHMMASLIAPKGYAAAPTAGADTEVWQDNLLQMLGPGGAR